MKPALEREKLLPGGPITNLKSRKLSTLEKPFSLCILPQLYGLFMEVVKGVHAHASICVPTHTCSRARAHTHTQRFSH